MKAGEYHGTIDELNRGILPHKVGQMEPTKGEWYLEDETGLILSIPEGKDSPVVIANVGGTGDITPKPLKELQSNAHLIAAAPNTYEELKEADSIICELCKRLNPQHATADYGKGCEWCEDREGRLKAIAKAEGK